MVPSAAHPRETRNLPNGATHSMNSSILLLLLRERERSNPANAGCTEDAKIAQTHIKSETHRASLHDVMIDRSIVGVGVGVSGIGFLPSFGVVGAALGGG